jgi:MFS family permease
MWVVGIGMFIPALRHPWVLGIAGLPVGIGFLLTIPAWFASVSDLDKTRRGANIGAVMTAQGLGTIVGAPIGSALYEKLQPIGVSLGLGEGFGRYSPFVGCAACLTAGLLMSLKILRPPTGALEPEPQPEPEPEPAPTPTQESAPKTPPAPTPVPTNWEEP